MARRVMIFLCWAAGSLHFLISLVNAASASVNLTSASSGPASGEEQTRHSQELSLRGGFTLCSGRFGKRLEKGSQV